MEYPIEPRHIDTDRHFWNAFGHNETEVFANLLVRMAKVNGDWQDFTKEKIDTFCGLYFCFHRLLENGWIKENCKEGTYSFTHVFIAKCFSSSPAKDVENCFFVFK